MEVLFLPFSAVDLWTQCKINFVDELLLDLPPPPHQNYLYPPLWSLVLCFYLLDGFYNSPTPLVGGGVYMSFAVMGVSTDINIIGTRL